MPDLGGDRARVPTWARASLFQFASGIAVAVGLVGVTRTGRDVWLGVALIVMAAAFALRGIALTEHARAQDADSLKHELQELGARLPAGLAGPTTADSRWRGWLARFRG